MVARLKLAFTFILGLTPNNRRVYQGGVGQAWATLLVVACAAPIWANDAVGPWSWPTHQSPKASLIEPLLSIP